ncbi:AfsR/SARP family transcriptional regulator [Streptomyces sp. NPDC048290]|uniref:AfsR/SARP family transcriptional regulator n=1 Tax=Streptomyces sp. NPDC048290 TaxID=3155811 RepID=UPI003426CDD7
MQIKTLGPLVAQENQISLVPSAGKPRQVLSLLALNANRAISVGTLIEEIWGDDPPRSYATTLQTYILQLRRNLDAALKAAQGDGDRATAKDILVTQHNGYLLRVNPRDIDVHEFEALSDRARSAASSGEDAAASALFTEALSLWNGPPLVDVSIGRVLEPEVMRLKEARLAAVEGRLTARLRLGRHAELLSELTVLTMQYPMHENLCAQFMIALHRSGRSWNALEAYQKLRDTMIEELGLEPSARLRRLHQAVLAGDPLLDALEAVDGLDFERQTIRAQQKPVECQTVRSAKAGVTASRSGSRF